MKSSLKKLVLVFLLVICRFTINAQTCVVKQQDVVKGTMGKKTDKAVFIGQSFIACKTGALTTISFRIGGGNEVENVELRIFEDKKIAQKPLYKKPVKLPMPSLPVSNYEDIIINIEKSNFQLEEGKTYTIGFFKTKSSEKQLLRFKSDNTNSFKEGSLVANSKIPGGKRQNKDVDMIFSFTIK
ncbi:hypothetical protein [Polaribacter tangerinus]|uniref:hypothetical protein n=1 Tax=Polaribacter tangerinus TaxID=1920034 RepID=UPI000B4B1492|nr:hypothetical protein [Polaribacter tangerinus]